MWNKILKKVPVLWASLTLIWAPCIGADDNDSQLPTIEVSSKDPIEVFKLPNGMKVAVKHAEGDSVYFRFVAAGGYASLPPDQRVSAEISPQVALRSGFGKYTFDTLHAHLYDYSIDLSPTVQPFARTIEGKANTRSVEQFLQLVNLFFTQASYTQEAFQKEVEKAKEQLLRRSKNRSREYEDTYLAFNTLNFPPLLPLTSNDIEKADFATAKRYFEAHFGNPDGYVCVIVGPIDTKEIRSLIQKHLVPIPKRSDSSASTPLPQPLSSPSSVASKVVGTRQQPQDSVTRLTFSIMGDLGEKEYDDLDTLVLLLNMRLKKKLTASFGQDTVILNVSLKYPQSPLLNCPWIVIQYISDAKFARPAEQSILAEIKKMQKEGITQEEIAVLEHKLLKAERLRESDSRYWLTLLSNYLLLNWEVDHLKQKQPPTPDGKAIKAILQKYMTLDRYTYISS